jgi:hypothetical protein
MTGKIFAAKLHNIENGILGVKNNPEIQAKLSVFGYTPERMEQGEQLLTSAIRLMTTQVSEYSDKYSAVAEMEKLWDASYSTYMVTLKVIRVAFKGQTDLLVRFDATGNRPRSLSGWLRSARILYTNLLDTPEALTKMSLFGYTAERLQQEQQAVKEVENLYSKQLSEKGAAQQATVERDKALDEICNWYSDFRAIARVALYEKPQLLEALGIVKKGRKPRKQEQSEQNE